MNPYPAPENAAGPEIRETPVGIHILVMVGLATLACAVVTVAAEDRRRPQVTVRGIYGGVPTQLFDRGKTLEDFGVNAIWMGAGGLSVERIALLRKHGARVYAEFNTVHDAAYLKEHPDAAPVGTDGEVSPPPDGWQGVCPTHEAYRRYRMDAFRRALTDFEIDGIWLDYHHSHAAWEQAVPNMPDTCFCDRCLVQFQREAGAPLPDGTRADRAAYILKNKKAEWVRWRCGVFTDWVREFREILDKTRPQALLGTFHCPWSDADYAGARIEKLNIDLKAQAKYLDVFSIMPYHARFGHHTDPEWIHRQARWLGEYLGIEGKPGERHKIWPIVQLSDWGESVPADQVRSVLDYGTRAPSSGVMVFAWGRLHESWEKVDEMGRFYRSIR